MKRAYPDGITKMDDYLGAIVKLRRRFRRGDGTLLRPGSTFIVTGHWRGRLTLSYRDKTLGGHRHVAARQVNRWNVDVLAVRLA